MFGFKSLIAAAAVSLCALPAFASHVASPLAGTSVGVAIDGLGGSAVGNSLFSRAALNELNGGSAIQYYIPLGDTSGTYGAGNTNGNDGFGQAPDFGNGGGTLTMILEFGGLQIGREYELVMIFEDLDVVGAADTGSFFEDIEILDDLGNSLSGLLDNLNDPYISGDQDVQRIELSLAPVTEETLELQVAFTSNSTFNGTNTAEYLIAVLVPQPVPLPATGWLMIGAFGAAGLIARRRRK